MSPQFFIALRYLKARRRGLFSFIVTLIGVAGVSVGVAALIVTLSIMNGFQGDIKEKILDAQAHVIVYGKIPKSETGYYLKRIKSEANVAEAAPFVFGQAILTFGGRSAGVMVKGMLPEREFRINNLGKSLVYGDWKNFSRVEGEKVPPPVILGEELAKNIGVWLGDEVVLVSPRSAATSFGILPRMKKFRIVGLIKTGYYEFDSQTAYCLLRDASDFFGLSGGISGFGIKLKDIKFSKKVAASLRRDLGISFAVKTYAEMNRTLFSALKLEKFVMSLVLALIILVATFNIASNLILMSVEKLRDIGILRSIGADSRVIRGIFLWEGNLIALGGILIGLSLGLAVCWFIATYPVIELPADIYYITKVPVKVEFRDIIATVLVSYGLCMASAVYPAWRASRVNPVDAIRYG